MWPCRSAMRRKLSEAISADELASSAAQASASPTSAIAAASDIDTFGRAAMTFWMPGWPPATRSIRSASVKQRRARQHDCRHFRLVGGQCADDLGRRVLAHRQRLGQRQPHLGRRIVEQQRQRGFGGAAVLERQVAVDIGAGQARPPRRRSATFAVLTHFRKWLTTITRDLHSANVATLEAIGLRTVHHVSLTGLPASAHGALSTAIRSAEIPIGGLDGAWQGSISRNSWSAR